MKKRILILLAVVMVASLGYALVAHADSERGTGTLKAEGDGLAGLHGTGWMSVSGNGVLWVKGAENIVVQGEGHKKDFPDGWIEYIGFDGTARIRGQEVSVILAGERIDLYAIGSGRVILWGEGTYEVDSLITGAWSETIKIVSY